MTRMEVGNRGRKWIRAEIERLDPVADTERVYSLIVSQLTPQSAVGLNLYADHVLAGGGCAARDQERSQ
jgi:hypothetical protein